MSLSGVFRPTVPLRRAAPSIDWTRLLTKYEGEKRAEVASYRKECLTLESQYERFSSPPAAINWAGYKEFFNDHPQILKMQQDFENFTYPTYSYESREQIHEKMANEFSAAEKLTKSSIEGVEELTPKIQKLKDTMTHEFTTAEDYFEKHPGMKEWLDDHVARCQWSRGIRKGYDDE